MHGGQRRDTELGVHELKQVLGREVGLLRGVKLSHFLLFYSLRPQTLSLTAGLALSRCLADEHFSESSPLLQVW